MKAILILVLLAAVAAVSLAVTSDRTALSINPAITAIGANTPVSVRMSNPHGVRRVHAYLEQNGTEYAVFDQTSAATRFRWRHNAPAQTVTFHAGKDEAPSLKEGKAQLVVEAVSNDFRGSTDRAAEEVNVVLEAPRVIPDEAQHYINQGGMELVTFTPSGNWTESGVKVGPYTFRSFPLPGHPGQRFSMFAYSWELPDNIQPVVFARNRAGTEATASFWFKVFPKKFRVRDEEIDDRLMSKLVNSVDPTGQIAPGNDLVSRFLYIDDVLRKKDNNILYNLRDKTEQKILWDGPFLHWGKEEADFADVRNWIYKGKKIDQAVHLGFDLSDVENEPILAANNGRVVWASNLGIFGNCIVLDHGYGLQSIYGHAREIDVKLGDMVKKGQKMGIAGETGFAGGVHIHFGMMIDGVQVNPREWWDEHWIHDRIMSKLQPQ